MNIRPMKVIKAMNAIVDQEVPPLSCIVIGNEGISVLCVTQVTTLIAMARLYIARKRIDLILVWLVFISVLLSLLWDRNSVIYLYLPLIPTVAMQASHTTAKTRMAIIRAMMKMDL